MCADPDYPRQPVLARVQEQTYQEPLLLEDVSEEELSVGVAVVVGAAVLVM